MAQNEDQLKSGWLQPVVVAVLVALLAGSTAPWWWQDLKTALRKFTQPTEQITNDCRLLGSRIEMPIEVKNGSCFLSENKHYRSYIKMITRNAVIYSNFKGKEVTCLLGDTCSFGWPNSPKFNVSFSGHPDERMYIFNAD